MTLRVNSVSTRNVGMPVSNPVHPEPAGVEKQQNIEGGIDLLLTEPAIAAVPTANFIAVQTRKFCSEHGIEVTIRIAADGGAARIQGNVFQIVQPGKQAHLGERAYPREQSEFDVRVAELDGRVEPVQGLAVGLGRVRLRQRVEDRLIVFTDQHDHPLPGAFVQGFDNLGEADGALGVAWGRPTRRSMASSCATTSSCK